MKKQNAVQAWKMLVLSLFKGIAAFVTVVAGLSVSLPLSVFLVGLPLLAETLVLCRRMMDAENRYAMAWKMGQHNEPQAIADKPANGKWSGWRSLLSVLGQGRSYRSIFYSLLQLPVGIAGFVLAVVLPVTAWAVMLSPLAYYVSRKFFAFDLFADEVVMNTLLPDWSSLYHAWLYGGVGFLFVLFLPVILRMLGRLYAGWIQAIAGSETRQPWIPIDSREVDDHPFESLPEPPLHA